ncbi:twin-arginine translocation signal domain-containing protein, partial [Kitasatospora cineracea]|uniref:twin-arginine translocation signal domain-containing protein n=1 Tax=Kitasatospora cineracea TaxID=88074 RepID=UPI00340E20AB
MAHPPAHPSRRTVLRTTTTAGLLAAVPGSAVLWSQPAVAGVPGPEQVHLRIALDQDLVGEVRTRFRYAAAAPHEVRLTF